MQIVNRQTKEATEIKYDKNVRFLYHNFIGRILLKLINNRLVSNIVARYMNSRISTRRISKTIEENKINMDLFMKEDWPSFNSFFIRKKKDLNFDMNKNHFVSPCDSKLLAMKLNKNSTFDIKGSIYTLKDIINDDLSKDYANGYALIFRLEVGDYHRYHFIDDGERLDYHFINGKLNTVQPIAYEKYKVFHTNCREWTILHTKNFGDVIEIEVGAMMIGKISNHKEITKFKKGEEKGYFEFGGSTIILFVKDGNIILDNDILLNSSLGNETIVSCGEKIGIKK